MILSCNVIGNTAQFKAHGLLEYYSVSLPKKSYCAIRTPELCGIAYNTIFSSRGCEKSCLTL